jgi:hypothetical protein
MEEKQMKSLNRLSADQLQKKLDNGDFTAAQRPVIVQMIKTKRGNVASEDAAVSSSADAPEAGAPAAEGTVASDAETVAKAEEVAAASVATKKKPGETTYTIEKFTDDTKGIRAGDTISFNQSNKGTGPVIEGVAQRIFRWFEKDREEVKIKGTDGKRYYRFEKDITLVAKAAPKAAEAPKAEAAPEAPQAEGSVEEPKAE